MSKKKRKQFFKNSKFAEIDLDLIIKAIEATYCTVVNEDISERNGRKNINRNASARNESYVTVDTESNTEYNLDANTDQLHDAQTEEQAAVELDNRMKLRRSSSINPKITRKTLRSMRTCGSLKKEWLSMITDFDICYEMLSQFVGHF